MRIIDIHTHGIDGYDTKGATSEDILRIAEIQGSCGVDAIIPTIYPASIKEMRMDIAAVKKAIEIQGEDGGWGMGLSSRSREDGSKKNLLHKTDNIKSATILGVHLEGPFLNPEHAGALDKNYFLPVKISNFEKLIEGFEDIIKIITVAPELDRATKLIKSTIDTGVVVSMGHSGATYSEAEAGFNAGAKGITHIFNAMRGIHHREPGIAGFGLMNPHVYIEVIADPFHLHQKIMKFIFTAKDPEKIIIVSDSIKTTQTNNEIRDLRDSTGKLPGGSMTVTASAGYLIGLGFHKETVEQCICSNPARYLAH